MVTACPTPRAPPWATREVARAWHAPETEADFKYDGPGLGKGGTATLLVDGKPVGEGKLARTLAFRMSLDETLDCGEDTGTPVSEDYHVPFRFTGKIDKVAVRIGDAALSPEEKRELDEIRGRGVMAE